MARISPTRLARLDAREERPLDWLRGRAVLAVSGLADPRSFHQQLAALGADVEPLEYPDHHPFSAPEARELLARAGDRPILMTRKDAVKLRPLLNAAGRAWVLDQEVEMEEGGEALERLLDRAVAG